ncbi:MAG: MoxR family ATPase [Anaerolineae bacterium]|nr:MoxR family ATPase [Anaerolineae bacterium]
MNDLAERQYVGDGQPHHELLDGAWTDPEPYQATPELAEAVNVALYLRRPLLVEGDPGCGKTRLAYAVAYELGYPLKECYIRSTSRAQDLLYTYDAVRRLYDIQEKIHKPHRDYIGLGPLGQAIELSQRGIPSVVLIDEIDKADIDFPNDLLLVLDRLWFKADEVPDEEGGFRVDAHKEDHARKDVWPLVIVTSNREKELPKPFLRRCLFYYISFPDQKTLTKIVTSHTQHTITPLFEVALQRFWQLREQQAFTWRKIPSTSELLDWIQLLERDEQTGKVTIETLISALFNQLPHLEVLVKTQSDRDALDTMAK